MICLHNVLCLSAPGEVITLCEDVIVVLLTNNNVPFPRETPETGDFHQTSPCMQDVHNEKDLGKKKGGILFINTIGNLFPLN